MNAWLQLVLSLAIGSITAVAAFFGVRMSVRGNDRATEQRELAARREEWWRRFTWAAELTLDDAEHKRVVGLNLLTTLARSDLARREECLLLDVFQQRVLESVLAAEGQQSGE